MATSAPPGILIVDQGASFGGSAMVAAVIANRMPPDRFRVFLDIAADPGFLRTEEEASARVVQVAKSYDYVSQLQRRSRLRGLPMPLRRLASWGDTGLRMMRNAGYTRRLLRQVRRDHIALVHLNNGFENLEAHLAAGLAGRPVLVHAHGPCGNSRLSRQLGKHASACVAISRHVVESFQAIGVEPERIALMPNPLTVQPNPLSAEERRIARARHGIPDDMVTAGIVGRIVAWKGQLEFLRAMAVALRQVNHAGALVIGDVTDANDEYGHLLRDEVQRLGIQDRVWFTGFVNEPRETYGLLDLLVHCSIEPEPFGLVLTEAMAYGIPVVAAAAGGPAEILTDGVDGYLANPRDTDTLGALLARLLRDPVLRAETGRAGNASAVKRFDPDVYVRRMADVYDSVLAQRPLPQV